MRKLKPKDKDKSKRKVKGTFVFFIGDEGAVLTYIENKEVVRRLFSPHPDDKATSTFRELLAENADAKIYLLADLMDQSYVRHTLPPVTPLGVNKIIQRRLARDFSADDLKGAISLGRESAGRKDWNFLLVALAYGGVLKQWCEMLYDLPNRFMGVYLAPVESELMIHHINQVIATDANPNGDKPAQKKSKGSFNVQALSFSKTQKTPKTPENTSWDILVVHNKTGGFRQVVLKNSKLVFTRLAQSAPNEKPTITAGNIEQEIKNTIEYLKRLSFNDSSTLHILILIGEDIKPHISTEAFNATNAHAFTPHEMAEKLKMPNCVLSGDRYSDIFLSCLFTQIKKHKLRLLPNYVKKMESYYQAIFGVKTLAALVVTGLILGSSYNLYNGVIANNNLVDAEDNKRKVASRVQEFEDEAANFEVDPFKVDSLIKIKDLVTETSPDYRDIVSAILPVIQKGITVQEFDWQLSGLIGNTNSAGRTAARPPSPSVPSMPSPTGTQQESHKVESSLSFELRINTSDEKEFIANWDRLFEEIQQANPAYEFERSVIPGVDNNQDELSINFEESSAANSASTMANEKKIVVTVTITEKPQDPNATSEQGIVE